MNYYPFHLGDYAAHTAHLEPMEDLAYRRMLDLYYMRNSALPLDPHEVARLVRLKSCVTEVESVLLEFFERTPGGWVNSRCDKEIAAFQAMSDGGRKGAAKRWAKGGDSHPIAPPLPTPLPTQPTPQCQLEPEPNTSVANATDGVPPAQGVDKKSKSPEDMAKVELWQAAVSVLEAGGCPKSQCRTFMGKLATDYTLPIVQQAVAAAVSAQPADAREYLKATCQRLKGERKDPVTVPSAAAAHTAEYLAEQAAKKAEPPPEHIRERLKKAAGAAALAGLAVRLAA